MATVQQQPTAPTNEVDHPRWQAFKRNWKYSNYITDFWNWLLTLLSKSAELVLFGSILYSSYQLIPGIAHVSGNVDAIVFVIQQAALDIGGLGLMKLAKRANLSKESFPMRVGMTLVGLMIFNVVLFSLKQSLPMIPALAFQIVETILLIARAVMAVLFGHAIHSLREEHGDSEITVKDVRELQQYMQQIEASTKATVEGIHTLNTEQMLKVVEVVQQVQVEVQLSVQQRLQSHTIELQQLLTPVLESLQDHAEVLAFIPDVAARLEQMEVLTQSQLTLVTEEFQRVKVTVEQQLQPLPQLVERITEKQTIVRAAQPRAKVTKVTNAPLSLPAGRFNKTQFVLDCLKEDSELSSSEMKRRALTLGQTLSDPIISMARSEFKNLQDGLQVEVQSEGEVVEVS
jgi:hypothetical protein